MIRFAASLLLVTTLSAQSPLTPTAESFAAWRDHILPTAAERAFEEIPWLSSFGEGVAAARERKRPLLFYAMNGHPLGCT